MESGNMPKGHKIHEYQLENVNQALEDLASGSVEGKIVVKFLSRGISPYSFSTPISYILLSVKSTSKAFRL